MENKSRDYFTIDLLHMTKIGSVIRACSFDELPQILNVIKGDRGIIGTTKKNIDFSSVVTA